MSVTGFLGMRGTGDWATDQRPKSWRQMILRLFPSGAAPLTAIMSKLKNEKVTDPEFNWWDKILAEQGGVVTDIFIDTLSTSYVRATHQAVQGIAGGQVYVQLPSNATANHFRAGHQIVLRDANRSDVDVVAFVDEVVKNAANSYLLVTLLEADDNSATVASFNLSTVDVVLIIGNANAEGAEMPDAVTYDPNKRFNYTQIYRTPFSITRTAQETMLRTGDPYKEQKLEILQYHGIEMDRSLLFSERYETVGSNNKPLRTTRGIIPWIRSDSNAVNSDFRIDASFSGTKWLNKGEDWLDDRLEQIFRFNEVKSLMGLCGSGFQLGLNKLAKVSGQINLTSRSVEYGLEVTTWRTSFGTIELITHPLLSYITEDRFKCVIGDPRRLSFRFVTDTKFKADNQDEGGANAKDAKDEEYLTEAGLELHHTRGWGLLDGAGNDSIV